MIIFFDYFLFLIYSNRNCKEMADFPLVSPGGPAKKNTNKGQQQYTSMFVLQPTALFFRFQTRREVLWGFFLQVGGIIDLILDFAAPQDGDCCGCSDKQGIEKWRITHSKNVACADCKDGGYLHQNEKCIGASQHYCTFYFPIKLVPDSFNFFQLTTIIFYQPKCCFIN